MIDYKKLVVDAKKIIHSHTADDLQAWIDMDNARMALVDREDNSIYLQELHHEKLRSVNRNL